MSARPCGRRAATVAAALAASIAATASAQERGGHFEPDTVYAVSAAEAPARGPDDAPVTIVEFSDFYCGYCRRAEPLVRELLALYGDRVRLVYRHYPLDPREHTLPAEAAEAARAQGRFWALHDRLFAADPPLDRAAIERHARAVGLDMVRFRRDLDERRHRDEVLADARAGAELGVRGTPTFFVNGRPIVGSQPMAVFFDVIERELARARRLIARGTEPGEVYAAITAGAAPQADGDAAAHHSPPPPDFRALAPEALGPPWRVMGPADALVTVVAFSDFQCPFCRDAVPILRTLSRELGRDLRIVYRHFPLRRSQGSHARAQLAAEASMAAGAQGEFWPFHDHVFADPEALERGDLERHARELGLDMAAFERALDRRRYLELVRSDAAAARALGVTATPTFFINGRVVRGLKPLSRMRELVENARERARDLVRKGLPRSRVYEVALAAAARAAGATRAEGGAPVELDQLDYQLAALMACKSGDAERAREFLEQVESRERRAVVERDCAELGVNLGD